MSCCHEAGTNRDERQMKIGTWNVREKGRLKNSVRMDTIREKENWKTKSNVETNDGEGKKRYGNFIMGNSRYCCRRQEEKVKLRLGIMYPCHKEDKYVSK